MKIILYKGISPVSKIIRWHTRSEYSHAAALLDDDTVVEAWRKGVEQVRDYKTNHTPGTIADIYSIEADEVLLKKAEQIFLKQVGRKYDFQGVSNFLTRSDSDVDERLFCSESVITGLNEAGIFLLKRIKPSQTSPRDISISPLLCLKKTVTV